MLIALFGHTSTAPKIKQSGIIYNETTTSTVMLFLRRGGRATKRNPAEHGSGVVSLPLVPLALTPGFRPLQQQHF